MHERTYLVREEENRENLARRIGNWGRDTGRSAIAQQAARRGRCGGRARSGRAHPTTIGPAMGGGHGHASTFRSYPIRAGPSAILGGPGLILADGIVGFDRRSRGDASLITHHGRRRSHGKRGRRKRGVCGGELHGGDLRRRAGETRETTSK